MNVSESMESDEILRYEEKQVRDARSTARFAPLWAETVLRSDFGLVIELATEANRIIEFEQGREARSERARQASVRGVASRAARKAERSALGRQLRPT